MSLGSVAVKTNGGALTVGAIPFSAGVVGTSASTGLGLGNFTLNNGFIANGTVLSNLTIGGVNDYGTITVNQVLGCATPTACGATGVSLGNGTTIPTFPITIQAGGMYASGTNTVASPAALSANGNGGNVYIGGAITTANQPIAILAGQAVASPAGQTTTYSSAAGGVTVMASLLSGGSNITLSNVNPNTGMGSGIESFNSRGVAVGANSTGYAPSMLSVNAGGGNIAITGMNRILGTEIVNTNIVTTGNGNINLNGVATLSGAGSWWGLPIGNTINQVSTLSTVNGAITITGSTAATAANSLGLGFWGGGTGVIAVYSTNGAINLTGIASTPNSGIQALATTATGSGGGTTTTYIGWSGPAGTGGVTPRVVTTGNISIQGQDGGNNAGMSLAGMSVATNGGALTVGAIPFSAGVAGTSASTGLGLGSFTLHNGFIVNGTVLSNLTIGGLNDYGTITMNQVLGCATPTACGATGVSLGNGTTIPTFPITIQAGGMYASGTNTVASPAAFSANTSGGNVTIGGSITTSNQSIKILAGSAVPLTIDANGEPLSYPTVQSKGAAAVVNSNLISGGKDIIISNTPLLFDSNHNVLSASSAQGGGAGNVALPYDAGTGLFIETAIIDASSATVGTGGNVWISGAGGSNWATGVQLRFNTTLKTSGQGNILVTGNTGNFGGSNYTDGIRILGTNGSTVVNIWTSGSGNISLIGTDQITSCGAECFGIGVTSGTLKVYNQNNTGAITLVGYEKKANDAIWMPGTTYIGWDGIVANTGNVTNGSISVLGQDSGLNSCTDCGMYLAGVQVNRSYALTGLQRYEK